jgi:exodeoxyribonuclease VII small subunit
MTEVKNKLKGASYEAKVHELEVIKEKLKSNTLPLAEIKSEMQRARQLYEECKKELMELEMMITKMEEDTTK